MRLPCEIIFSKLNIQKREVATKPKKGFAVLNKLKEDPPVFYLTFPVANDKNKDVYKLEPSKPPIILTPKKAEGKATFRFGTNTIFISKACPEKLQQLLTLIQKILAGENVDVKKIEIKSSDFKPSTMHIKSRDTYSSQMSNCSEFLKSLKIDAISLRMPDSTWAKCKNLTTLSLSGNPIGNNKKNLDIFENFKFLAVLELKGCDLGTMSLPNLFKLFGSMPSGIVSLDISENLLPIFPPIYHLARSLRSLNIARNRIMYLPSRVGFFRSLENINMCSNQISSLPWIFSILPNINEVSISSNDHVIRRANELADPITRRCFTKIDREEYTHVGGVDTLKTIAANSLHRNPSNLQASRKYLPLCLRFEMDDLLSTMARVSSLEMCTSCCKLRHIRHVVPINIQSQRIANQVDISGQFVVFNQLYCIDCFRPPKTQQIANDPHFFRFSI